MLFKPAAVVSHEQSNTGTPSSRTNKKYLCTCLFVVLYFETLTDRFYSGLLYCTITNFRIM